MVLHYCVYCIILYGKNLSHEITDVPPVVLYGLSVVKRIYSVKVTYHCVRQSSYSVTRWLGMVTIYPFNVATS